MAGKPLAGTAKRMSVTRRAAIASAVATLAIAPLRRARAAETVRIALPTKTYFPTVITEAAQRQKLFDKEGIAAEATVFRGGAECIEALAADAADLSLGGPPTVAVAIKKGVGMRLLATAARGYMGWYLMVKTGSPVTKVSELASKKIGITSAGSGSDFLALWSAEHFKTDFTRVPLGGGGLVPNLRSGNIDATVLYSPLSFELLLSKEARSIVDFTAEVPPHLVGGWVATDKLIKGKPEATQKALNALYGGLNWLRNNREAAIALIAEVDEIKPEIAAMEYENSILKLATDATISRPGLDRALELGKLIDITDTAPPEEIYSTKFVPVPTT
jgi:NitT/TauT family transport system substrate-binding protein